MSTSADSSIYPTKMIESGPRGELSTYTMSTKLYDHDQLTIVEIDNLAFQKFYDTYNGGDGTFSQFYDCIVKDPTIVEYYNSEREGYIHFAYFIGSGPIIDILFTDGTSSLISSVDFIQRANQSQSTKVLVTTYKHPIDKKHIN